MLDSQRLKAHDTAAPNNIPADLLGLGSQAKLAKSKKGGDAEHNPLATSVIDPDDDDDNTLPLSYIPEEAAEKEASNDAGDRAEAAAEEVVQNTADDAETAAGVVQGETSQVGRGRFWLKLTCGMC